MRQLHLKGSLHYWLLAGVLLLGTALRFWNLDFKPIWLDEVITALLSLGRSYSNVPLDRAFSLSYLDQIFTLNSEATCAQIMQAVTTQSVHPPLFFCWLHSWMNWVSSLPQSWLWKLRAFPALVGVVAIVALYQLNRVAFSPAAGLVGGAVMAVSPFAVYLSQEARHYTVPMLLVTLALLALYHLQTDLYQQQFRPALWFGWVILNSVGFYVHYFFLLAFAAQVLTLIVNTLTFKSLPTLYPAPYALHPRRALTAISLATSGVCLVYLPWLPTLLSHLSRPETNWLKPFEPTWLDKLAPLYQIPMGWVLMVIALPVENQPDWVTIPAVLLMLLFISWLMQQLPSRFGQLWSNPETHLATRMLVVFVLCVLLEFLAIVYVLDKNIVQIPRYNFIYFPAVCALLGACLAQRADEDAAGRQRTTRNNRRIAVVLLVGMISSAFVVTDFMFQKPYYPDRVAENLQVQPELPLLVGIAYKDLQDVALGLSFALALRDRTSSQTNTLLQPYIALLSRSQSYEQVWQALANLEQPLPFPLNLWILGPDLRRASFPTQLALQNQKKIPANCTIDPAHYHRVGAPYQLYRCTDPSVRL